MYNVWDRHYGNPGTFAYWICTNCTLEFLDPMPSGEELMAFYPQESYYAYTTDITKPDPAWKRTIRAVLFLEYATKDPSFERPGRMLDVGCGNGWFIYDMKQKGWDVKGVEPSKVAAEAGRRMGNLDIHHGDLISAGYPADSFDYIRFNHSFEHIPNPVETLQEVRRVLKPGGKALIGVPNIASLTAKLFGKYWYYLGAPVHTFNYSGKTLADLVSKQGFNKVETKYNGNWRGVVGSLQIIVNWNSNKASDVGYIQKIWLFRVVSGFIAKSLNLFRTGDVVEVIFQK